MIRAPPARGDGGLGLAVIKPCLWNHQSDRARREALRVCRIPPREEGEPIMRRLAIAFSAVAVFAAQAAFAVSDGQYLPANQNCTGNADNSASGNRTEAGCHNMIVFLADGTGHQYAGWGLDQTPGGTVVHNGEVWLDRRAGSCYSWNFHLTAGCAHQMAS